MQQRFLMAITALVLSTSAVSAGGRVLDGTPISIERAKTWCIAQAGPLPNWDTPAHPECAMVWKVFAERAGRVVYSARYAWPSPKSSGQPLRVLTEVLFEGAPGSRVVRRIYAVQDDETHIRLAPLRLLTVGGTEVIESTVCMSETRECGRELAALRGNRVEPIKDHTVTDIRSQLPKDYDLRMNPDVDVATLLGTGKAWAKRDADCCPSAAIEFTLRLDGGELHVEELKFLKRDG